jgi:hypothetical protein
MAQRASRARTTATALFVAACAALPAAQASAQSLTFTNRTTADGLGSDTVTSVYAAGSNVYASTANGLSISSNRGSTFVNRTTADGLGSNMVNGVYAAGSNVYAGTANGLSISTDGGSTFANRTTADGLGSNFVYRVYVTGSTVYATTFGGLSISTDGGSSFTTRTTADGLGSNTVWDVYATGSTVYAATALGLSTSTDGGSTFTNVTDAGGFNAFGVYATGGTVYAATANGLKISIDGGSTFVNRTTANGLGDDFVDDVYAVGGTIYAATRSGLGISTDGGATFTNLTTTSGLGNNQVSGVYTDGSTVYASTTGGLSIATTAVHPCPSEPDLAATASGTDDDGDGYCEDTYGTDCDDTNDDIYPGVTEICDGYDNDCYGGIDDGLTFLDYYADGDSDGYGDRSDTATSSCLAVAGEVTNALDCDDTNGAIKPGATEICDGYDNDCANGIDDGLTFLDYYADTDSDGYGDQNDTPTSSCSAVTGEVTNALDCDDTSAAIKPGATEICDGYDNDCANGPDDGLPFSDYYADGDSDGYGDRSDTATSSCLAVAGEVTNALDCDDTNGAIKPGATEICDGYDNDCANGIDDGLTFLDYYADADSDGYGDPLDTPTSSCSAVAGEAANALDCDDTSDDMYPGNPEVCDGYDNDCANGPDDGLTFLDYYADADSDGYGDQNDAATSSCLAVTGEVTNALDCDDTNDDMYPGNPEICDGYDNDCANGIDDGLTFLDYYADTDSDGYGDQYDTATSSCSPVAGEVANALDCDDTSDDMYPGNPEVCDGYDNDCANGIDDGLIFLDYYADTDSDGYGDPLDTPTSSCVPVPSEVTNALDCDAYSGDVYPGAIEVCDGVVNDCDAAPGTPPDVGFALSDYYIDGDFDGYGADPSYGAYCSREVATDAYGAQVQVLGSVPPSSITYSGGSTISNTSTLTREKAFAFETGPSAVRLNSLELPLDNGGSGAPAEVSFEVRLYESSAGIPGQLLTTVPVSVTVGPSLDYYELRLGGMELQPNTEYALSLANFSAPTRWRRPNPTPAPTSNVGFAFVGYAIRENATPTTWQSNSVYNPFWLDAGPDVVLVAGDCDPTSGDIYPGALEVCANVGVDNDCSQGGIGADKTAIDMVRYYFDGDSDGYGTGSGLLACAQPFGYDPDAGDCNDSSSAVNPGATETCDGINNDCDAYTDEGFTDTDSDGYADCVDPDKDGDGHGAGAGPSLDCDDYAADVYPGALENCANLAADNDCDGIYSADEAVDSTDYFTDSDSDGYGTGTAFKACSDTPTTAPVDGDCLDTSASVNPGEPELCDGYDNNCAGTPAIDEGFPNYDGDLLADCVDTDDDNDGDPDTTDCSDNDAYVYTGAAETCANYGTDNDCDGDIYDTVGVNWYRDADGDGYGDPAAHIVGCPELVGVPGGYVTNADDCDVYDAYGWTLTSPEVCDGYDNDCDSVNDDGFPDFDLDTLMDCVDPDDDNDTDPDTTDCNDNDADVYTDAMELIGNGVDDDCDGYELCYEDGDDDGFLDGYGGTIESADLYCTGANESATNSPTGDCDDAAVDVYPGALENCANLATDNDCDGYSDAAEAVDSTDFYTDADMDGFGTGSAFKACADTNVIAPVDGDCDDADGYVNPSATEVCDGIDNNCASGIDEGFPNFDSDSYADCVDGDIDGDGDLNTPDCDDYNVDVYTNALENCANLAVDNDCDGDTSAAEAVDSTDYYTDADSDDFGTGPAFKACSDTPFITDVYGDCNDVVVSQQMVTGQLVDVYGADVYPGAAEVCANINIDNDCDGNIFEADDLSAWAYDGDGDGYGTENPAQRIKACTAPNGYVEDTTDCNDADDDVYPGAAELCSNLGTDNDCDNVNDEAEATDRATWYGDVDGDGYGNPSTPALACSQPAQHVSNSGDCNDSANYAWTGRDEICDRYDNNCNSSIDEGVTITFYHDGDMDGFGDVYDPMQRCAAGDGYISNSTDCDDGNADAYPFAVELCATSTVDNNCDGDAADVDADAADKVDFYADADGDTWTTATTAKFCSGTTNTGWMPAANPTDCNDAYADIYPGAVENCDTINIDNDCDGNAEEAENARKYYRDADGDSYGSGTVFQIACSQPTGWGLTNQDCNDANAAAYPNAAELCATVGTDNDCDGYTDDVDADAADKVDFYADADGDTWTTSTTARFCSGTTNSGWRPTLSVPVDCNDGDIYVYPGALENCANIAVDNDCNEAADIYAEAVDSELYWADTDNDHYGAGPSFKQCTDDSTRAPESGDCAPTDPAINPGATELCDEVDNNCDGYNNEGFLDTDEDGSADCVDLDDDGDGDPDAYDCGPLDETRYHGAPELCADIGIDNDCDGNLNDASDFAPLWVDYDGDGFGDRNTSAVKSCAGPNMADNSEDCNDNNAAINPDAVEICDTYDNDCDELTDDADPGITGQPTWYADADVGGGDGFGDPDVYALSCTQPSGYVANNTDGCPTVKTLQAPATWWRDQDIDGYGDPDTTTDSCTQPSGYVGNSLDECPLHSGQFPSTWYADTDGDGFGDPDAYQSSCGQPSGHVANSGDGCPDVYALQAPVPYFVDGDGDGYGSAATAEFCSVTVPGGHSASSTDCNDDEIGLWTDVTYFGDGDHDGYGDPGDEYAVCSLVAPAGYVSNSDDECVSDSYKSEPGQCGCGVADTDSDGDGYADCVDTTPWLYLEPAEELFADGTVTVNVQLGARVPAQPTVGAQLALAYDSDVLEFVSITPGSSTAGDGLFSQPVFLDHNAEGATILYGVGVADSYGGDTFATRVAVITFRVADGVSALCGQDELVRFVPVGTALTRLSGTAGVPISPTTSDLGPINAYGEGVGFIGVPEAWTRPADAGLAGSIETQSDVTYVPPCTPLFGGVVVTVEHDLPGGDVAWVDGWPAGDLFPVGVTTVRWSADGESVERAFTVENYQVMELSVALDGVVAANSRTLAIASGGFTGTATQNLSGTATTVSVQVPVEAAGAYDCVSVKDAAHTLRSSATVSVTGTVYTASLVLEQGDSNNDNTVDILDFGMYVADFGTGVTSNARSNFNGDTLVSTADFAFISFNFFQVGSAGCAGAGDGGVASDDPMDRVSVAQLRKMGYGELAMADLNRDGWVDTADMALWMQGVRPEGDAGDASSGGNAAE